MRRFVFLAAALPLMLLGACASRVDLPSAEGPLRFQMQSSAIAPGNGGALVTGEALQPGDILLTSVETLNSIGIRLGTFSPVSHAVLYLGEGQVAEAVGSGVRVREVQAMLDEEFMVVAFRPQALSPEQAERLRAWALSQVGVPYNTAGVLLQAPFVLNRRLCELPGVPMPVRHYCVSGLATVQLGASRNDRFFCSQFVLEAFNQAGQPITAADPRWVSPADLLHMREGDVPSISAHQPLRYVGHLKYMAAGPVLADGSH